RGLTACTLGTLRWLWAIAITLTLVQGKVVLASVLYQSFICNRDNVGTSLQGIPGLAIDSCAGQTFTARITGTLPELDMLLSEAAAGIQASIYESLLVSRRRNSPTSLRVEDGLLALRAVTRK